MVGTKVSLGQKEGLGWLPERKGALALGHTGVWVGVMVLFRWVGVLHWTVGKQRETPIDHR